MRDRPVGGPNRSDRGAGAERLTVLHQRLTASLAEDGAFREPWLRGIFDRVPRHVFVPETVWYWSDGRWCPLHRGQEPERWAELVYHPTEPLITQVDEGKAAPDGTGREPTSSISAASAVVNMLASLDPQPGQRVLEIGTGTGYNAALLCERVGQDNVVTVEVDPVLADQAGKRLAAARYHPDVVCGDGERGHPGRGPFDRLISTASVRRVPPAWLRQVRPGGEIVTPWYPGPNAMGLIWLRVSEGEAGKGWFHGRDHRADGSPLRPSRPDRRGPARAGWWRENGEPGLYDFGITVSAERQTIWLREETNPVPVITPDAATA